MNSKGAMPGNVENEVKYRKCDDMLARRLGGNIPDHLRKKNESSHNKFITPVGNPMRYVHEHRKSRSLSEQEAELAEKNTERDERNARYEEMQVLKDVLKEEEDTWTSNLDKWKQRRRSATVDVRQRVQERVHLESQQAEPSAPRRRAKTFREMVEDKKRRDAGLFQDDDVYHSFAQSFDDDNKLEWKTGKKLYRGAMSVPVLNVKESQRPPIQSHTSTAVSTENHDARVAERDQSVIAVKPSLTRVSAIEDNEVQIDEEKNPNTNNNNSVQLIPFSHTPALPTVKVKQTSLEKETEESSGDVNENVSVSSSSDDDDSEPKSDVLKMRFASRRSMWESIASSKKPARSASLDLSTRIKQDTEQLAINGTLQAATRSDDVNEHHDNGANAYSTQHLPEPHKWKENKVETSNFNHKPKIMNLNYNFSQDSTQNSQNTFEPIHKYGNAPGLRHSLAKSYTLPSKLRISSVEDQTDKTKTIEPTNPFRLNLSALRKESPFTPRHSPRSGPTQINPMFEDLAISIKQRPKLDKGFGFTVRGGDDGRPVVVNTISPGGAAESCDLHVGDEILSINGVRLSSSLSQDDIVQLIVDSVITGSLSLSIRRYKKSKKTHQQWLSGSRFVKPSPVLPTHFSAPKENPFPSMFKPNNKNVVRNSSSFRPTGLDSVTLNSSRSKDETIQNFYQTGQAEPSIVNENNLTTSKLKDFNSGKENKAEVISSSSSANDKTLAKEAEKAEEKRKRIEKAREEEQRITEQLKKIEAAKQQQERKRREEKKKMLSSRSLYNGFCSYGKTSSWQHLGHNRYSVEGKPNIKIIEYIDGKDLLEGSVNSTQP